MGSKPIRYIVVGIILFVVSIAAWLAHDITRYAGQPADGSDDTPVAFTIYPGEGFNKVAERLTSQNLVRRPAYFKIVARIRGNDKHLKAGEYRLAPAMTPLRILDTFVNGEVFLYTLTIPEGYTLKQIAAELERLQLADAQDFEQAANDPEVVGAFGLQGRSLEGFLFPDTYHLPKGMPVKSIIAQMVARFREQFPEAWYARAEELGFSLLQVVTLAAIIEKETGQSSEMPLISSVFHNRLRKKMRLESDPTVIYGIEDFDGNLTRTHLNAVTEYNTYQIKGLPPGPIANPGRRAIEAALFPAETGFLFFVSKKDGTHQFSTTLKEHNEAVRRYQLRKPKSNP